MDESKNELIRPDEDVKSIYSVNGGEYRPTPCEEKLLVVLANPENLGKTITEKCRIAGISTDTYYLATKKQGFIDLLNKISVELIRDKVADILQASVKCAVNSGARGYQDRRMLLEMYGLVVKENDNKIVIVNMVGE